ncbi:CPBP family intramembrane glutamic endopeptidase [Yersinia mollaretii]|uniref:CPBP family intramembrane glutamic endopeptidase n=1 Tax=Yersinia mollaretii TaxID=33060 RepID=UPI0005E08E2B|nr:type II CAAX endopeptidase family protein [Yersinia mollaretii]MDN0111553.1 type II CAAX endopeptidase family protein [Yersinia mollaretii]PJE89738.1 CPBP family intramembrane metalloprotease [Yersinia mollaretii]CQD43480.1 CAAX amino terminal protease family protein [Yersinia mollaretii]CQH38747.1 CAAX amino terminal protease family protein [Yersinia mollaretii]
MWGVLAASLLFLSINRVLALFLLAASLSMAFYHGVLALPSAAFLLVTLIVALLLNKYRSHKWLAIGLEIMLVLASIALFLHLVPGFNNLKVLDKVTVGPLSAPFSMYYNLDKALLPFILLACLPTLFVAKKHPSMGRMGWVVLIVSMPALLLLATALGGLKIELHTPAWIGSFIIANVFFVCLAEEALFRGYLQQRLSQWLGSYPALILTALLFGAAHFAGGPLLMVFATLAGLIYGLAWLWSGRLWVAVAFHFAFNLLHLLFFTYPLYLPH